MSEQGKNEEQERQDEGLSALAKDSAHPFDQTNGIVDGLEGDADDPEKVDERLQRGTGSSGEDAN